MSRYGNIGLKLFFEKETRHALFSRSRVGYVVFYSPTDKFACRRLVSTIDLNLGPVDEYPMHDIGETSIQIPVRRGSIRQLARNLDIDGEGPLTLSEGKEDSNETNPLPARDPLLEGLAHLQTYLEQEGLPLVADSHLRGEAAPVVLTDNTLYAIVGSQLFGSIRESWEFDVSDSVWAAIETLYTLEVTLMSEDLDTHPAEAASWPSVTGRQVEQTSGLVTTVEFPLRSVDTSPLVVGRGVALGAGARRFATDAGLSFKQTGPYYLYHHLRSNPDTSLSGSEALSEVAELYSTDVVDIDRACVAVSEKLQSSPSGAVPDTTEKASQRYYLSEKMAVGVIEALTSGLYEPKY